VRHERSRKMKRCPLCEQKLSSRGKMWMIWKIFEMFRWRRRRSLAKARAFRGGE
jgi:hypothetical protein